MSGHYHSLTTSEQKVDLSQCSKLLVIAGSCFMGSAIIANAYSNYAAQHYVALPGTISATRSVGVQHPVQPVLGLQRSLSNGPLNALPQEIQVGSTGTEARNQASLLWLAAPLTALLGLVLWSKQRGQPVTTEAPLWNIATLAAGEASPWSRIRNAHKANVLNHLDVEEGLSMASAAGESEVTYHFLVANAKFMLYDEEHAMELLREKRRFLKEKGLPQDFWIVPNPEFLEKLPDIDKRVLKPCAALVSTDEKWILFMKLRYDRVLLGSFKGSSDYKKELATKGGDALAAVPKFDLPKDWEKSVPYPKYSDDWFHPFLVSPPSA